MSPGRIRAPPARVSHPSYGPPGRRGSARALYSVHPNQANAHARQFDSAQANRSRPRSFPIRAHSREFAVCDLRSPNSNLPSVKPNQTKSGRIKPNWPENYSRFSICDLRLVPAKRGHRGSAITDLRPCATWNIFVARSRTCPGEARFSWQGEAGALLPLPMNKLSPPASDLA
jgi:hypothetical protein